MATIIQVPVAIPVKVWKNVLTKEVRGIGSALEGDGWVIGEQGWTIDWGNGQRGTGGRFCPEEADAQAIISAQLAKRNVLNKLESEKKP